MKIRKPNRIWILAGVSAALVLVALVLRFEPFARRVEAKTIGQWLNAFAATKQVEPRILAAFDISAHPDLVRNIRSGRREIMIRSLLQESVGLRTSISHRKWGMMLAAGGWLALLNAEGYPVKLPGDLGLWLDQQDDNFYAPRFAQLALTTRHEAATLVDVPVPKLRPGEKIAIGAKVQPSRVTAAKSPWLFVKVQIAPGHHIYALEKSLSSSVPTRVEVKLPDGVRLEGPWSPPRPEKIGGALVYRKEVVFPNRLLLNKDFPPGKYKAEIKVSFQVCNEALCWPPESLVTEVEFEVVEDAAKK
jgi:hypothetical protein